MTDDATTSDLEVRLARYRTALVALLAMLGRQSRSYRDHADQELIRSVAQLLADEQRD